MQLRILRVQVQCLFAFNIMLTCPCNENLLTPHFYIVKLRFTEVYIISYLCSKTEIVGTR